jgi:3-hydroxyisobutyrate dehydrogenase
MTRGHVAIVGSGRTAMYLVARMAAVGYRVKVYVGEGGDVVAVPRCGAVEVDVPADAAEEADIVLLAMHDERAVEDAVFDCGGVAETLPNARAVLDLSSVSATYCVRAHERMAALGLGWLEGALIGGAGSMAPSFLCVIGACGGVVAPALLPVMHDLAQIVEVRGDVAGVARLRHALESLETSTAA